MEGRQREREREKRLGEEKEKGKIRKYMKGDVWIIHS